jgi:hypothetical protein
VTVVIARLAAGEGQPGGLGADGEALQSVYLGRGPVAAPNGRAARPPARPRGRPAPAAAGNRPPRDNGRLGIALLLFLALALVGGVLAYAAFSGVQNETPLNVAGLSIGPALLAGICAVLALLFGFLMGYIGRKWLVERHH